MQSMGRLMNSCCGIERLPVGFSFGFLCSLLFLDEKQKEHFAKLMAQMIIVDEDINVNEVAIYNVVPDFCGIDKDFNESLSDKEIEHCSKSE